MKTEAEKHNDLFHVICSYYTNGKGLTRAGYKIARDLTPLILDWHNNQQQQPAMTEEPLYREMTDEERRNRDYISKLYDKVTSGEVKFCDNSCKQPAMTEEQMEQEARNKLLKGVLDAWNNLEGNKEYGKKDIEHWLIIKMAPAIDEIRKHLTPNHNLAREVKD